MKLRQLIKAHFDTNGPTPMGRGVVDYVIQPNVLTVYQEEINTCTDFGGAKVNIVPEVKSGKPQRVLNGYDEEGVPMYGMKFETIAVGSEEPMVTVKLGPNTKFAPVVNLFSISLSPEIFDPQDIFKTKLDTVWITPSIYEPDLMKPLKRIIVTFNPETAQDSAISVLKKEMREIDKVEERPEFTITADKKEKVEEQIKENLDVAKDVMETINKDEITSKIQEEENKYIQTLLDMVHKCFTEPSSHTMPSKRTILLRVTKNSLVENDKPINNPDDTVVVLSNGNQNENK